MKLKTILFFLLALEGTTLFAQQNNNTIKGRVTDINDKSVMFATVCLLNNEKIVAGGLTDTMGFFSIRGQFIGEYRLRVSSVGYEDTSIAISLKKDQKLDLGHVVLAYKVTRLSDVAITAEAMNKTVTAERTSFNPATFAADGQGGSGDNSGMDG